MTDVVLKDDAIEMMQILRTAQCANRYSTISLGTVAELLVALTTGSAVARGNEVGHDVVSPTLGRIEVKSRVLGTDGPFPRVSLSPSKFKNTDYFVAVRWTRDKQIYDAVGLSNAQAEVLYRSKLQRDGRTAHIAWNDWIAASGARSFREEMLLLVSEF